MFINRCPFYPVWFLFLLYFERFQSMMFYWTFSFLILILFSIDFFLFFFFLPSCCLPGILLSWVKLGLLSKTIWQQDSALRSWSRTSGMMRSKQRCLVTTNRSVFGFFRTNGSTVKHGGGGVIIWVWNHPLDDLYAAGINAQFIFFAEKPNHGPKHCSRSETVWLQRKDLKRSSQRPDWEVEWTRTFPSNVPESEDQEQVLPAAGSVVGSGLRTSVIWVKSFLENRIRFWSSPVSCRALKEQRQRSDSSALISYWSGAFSVCKGSAEQKHSCCCSHCQPIQRPFCSFSRIWGSKSCRGALMSLKRESEPWGAAETMFHSWSHRHPDLHHRKWWEGRAIWTEAGSWASSLRSRKEGCESSTGAKSFLLLLFLRTLKSSLLGLDPRFCSAAVCFP